MEKLLIGLFLMMICFIGKAQNKSYEIICPIENQPEFKGGMKGLQTFLEQNLKKPNTNIHGKVYIQFIVEKDGKITHPVILKSLSEKCDAEALRVVKIMPRWIPAKDLSGKKPLRTRFTIPIKFEIEE